MSKILQVNPKLFEFSSRRRSRKRTEDEDGEKRTGGEIRVRAPTVPKRPTLSNRNAILKFIRDHQRRNEEGGRGGTSLSDTDTDTDTSDFNDSLNYLIDIAKQVEESSAQPQAQAPVADRRQLWSSAIVPASSNPSVARAHNHTLKSYSADYGGVSPYAQQYANIAPDPHVSTVYPDVLSAGGSIRLEPPKYGCLKGGTLPTYRTYYQLNTPHVTSMTPRHSAAIHGQTLPHHHNVTQRRDMGSFAAAPARVTDLVETSRSAAVPPKLVFPKQKRTVRRTFKIGKSKVHPRVSVLISNRNIRRNITTKVHDLKQVSIPEIKRFLIKRGLIRVGTAAPNDVLRKMYESATMLCGDVYNHNPDTLLYNFFNDDTAVPP